LNLTDEQRSQIDELDKDVAQRLKKILTSDQWKQLSRFRPPRPGGQRGNGDQGGMPPNDREGDRPSRDREDDRPEPPPA
jgi:hypothetical protein